MRARCIEFDPGPEQQRFVGEHYGYERLEDPVVHRREILFEPATQRIEVNDTLRCEGVHNVTRCWHFAEDCQVERAGAGLKVNTGTTQVWFEPLDPPGEVHLHRAGTAEQGGWVSRRFGHKQPSTSVHWHSPVNGQTVLRTRITWTRSRGVGI